MDKKLVRSLGLVLAGIAAVGVGTFFTVSARKQLARDTEPASATVVDYIEGTEHNSTTDTMDIVYFPVVSYEVDGKTIESEYSQYYLDYEFEIGENIDIKYNPDDPEEFVIVEDSRFKSGTVWVIPVGALIAVYGLASLVAPALKATKRKTHE